MASRKFTFNSVELAVSCLLLLGVLVIYGQTTLFEFVNLDDPGYVYNNKLIQSGPTPSAIGHAFTQTPEANWIPLVWISLMLDWQIFGLYAGGYHLTNVLLHSATTILMFFALLRMTDRLGPSAFATALFALHPLRVESVAWVTERKDVLSGLFFALTLLAYVSYARRAFSWKRYGWVLLAFALGLMSKAILVTVPFLLLLLDWWPLNRLTWAQEPMPKDSIRFRQASLGALVVEKLPLFCMAFAVCLITLLIQGDTLSPNERLSFSWRLGNAAISYVEYLWMFLRPTDLIAAYPRFPSELSTLTVVVACVILATISAIAFFLRKRCPYLLVGWLWYLGMMLPVIGLVQVGLVSVADRFTYLPQIGLAMAVAFGAADLCRRVHLIDRLSISAAVVLILALTAWSFYLTSFWQNSETLWNRTLAIAPNNYTAHNNLGNELASMGRIAEAMEHYQRTLELVPNNAIALCNIGDLLIEFKKPDQALEYYERTLKYTPNHIRALDRLGYLAIEQGQYAKAVEYLEKSLALRDNNPEAQFDLAKAYMALGNADAAKQHLKKGWHYDPNYAKGHNMLGLVTAMRGLKIEPIEHFQRAIDASPDFVDARMNLAEMLAKIGRKPEAIAQYEALLKISPQNSEAQKRLDALRAGLPSAKQP